MRAERYELHAEIARGGMATVHLGCLRGAGGWSRIVAIKRLHPQFARDVTFRTMLEDEARLSARVRHPNVVQTLDVVAHQDELWLVLEYVHGVSLARLLDAALRAGEAVPPPVAVSIACGMLEGLAVAHEATGVRGEPLGLVHRDVSPQNVLVGADGVARLADFGVAKARGRAQTTTDGQVKGKLAYMAPEQVSGTRIDRRADVWATGVVLWEALVGRRLFQGTDAEIASRVLAAPIEAPSRCRPGLPEALDVVVLGALQREPTRRLGDAREMVRRLAAAVTPATAGEVAAWVDEQASVELGARGALVERVETGAPTQEAPATSEVALGAETLAGAAGSAPRPVSLAGERSVTQATVSLRPPRRSATFGIVLGAGGALGILLLVLWALERDRAPRAEPRPAPIVVAAPADATSPVAVDAAAPAPAVAVPAAPADTSAEANTWRERARPAKRARGKAHRRAGPDCNPPYVIDAEGHKRYKRECF